MVTGVSAWTGNILDVNIILSRVISSGKTPLETPMSQHILTSYQTAFFIVIASARPQHIYCVQWIPEVYTTQLCHMTQHMACSFCC